MKKLFLLVFSLSIAVDSLSAFESTYKPLKSEKVLFINGIFLMERVMNYLILTYL
jgi:hypothetical protein